MVKPDPIWILDSDTSSVTLYHQTLGLLYPLHIFENFEQFIAAFREAPKGQPRLLIVEPDNDKDALANFFRGIATSEKHFPETLIVSRIEDIDTMRFYLRTGVRDYILKPLRPNELVSKVERSLMTIDSRSVLIFRNDLDGQQVPNLTFREHQILTVLLNKPSRTAQRDQVIESVWSKTLVNRKTLDVHIFNLRRKLRPIGYDVLCRDKELYLAKLNPNRK